MNILALDTATKTGYATHFGNHGMCSRSSGAEDFSVSSGSHPGKRFKLFSSWLREKIREDKPDLIVYESIVGGMRAGGKTSLVQKGLEALVLMEAYRALQDSSIPVWSFAPATIKKWATGSGELGVIGKQNMISEALRRFSDQEFIKHNPTKSQPWAYDDNQCDALWLVDLTYTVVKHYMSLQTDPEWDLDLAKIEELGQLTLVANIVTKTKWSPAKSRSKTK